MPEHYGDSEKKESTKKSMGGKLSDRQKKQLNKHMGESGLTGTDAKRHRMAMMSRMRRGMSIKKAHADITK